MSNIKSNTVINHPDGVCTLAEIQADVDAFMRIAHPYTFGFTPVTVQTLIDKIAELQTEIQQNKIDKG